MNLYVNTMKLVDLYGNKVLDNFDEQINNKIKDLHEKNIKSIKDTKNYNLLKSKSMIHCKNNVKKIEDKLTEINSDNENELLSEEVLSEEVLSQEEYDDNDFVDDMIRLN